MYRSYPGPPLGSHPSRDVESQLRDLSQDFAMSFNTGNYDQAAALFANDGVLMTPLREAVYGQKQVEHLLRQLADAGYGGLRLETTRVDYSGDMAMELGLFTVVIRQEDGTLVPERGKYVRVWKRLGAWLLMADCWTRTGHAISERAA
jgi:ketosteroid isomerase-like protein